MASAAAKKLPTRAGSGSKDPLASLLSSAEEIGPKSSSKSSKQDELFIKLEGDQAAAFDTFASAKAIADLAEDAQGLARTATIDVTLAEFAKLCIEQGRRLDNPQIVSTESSAKFEVKHQAKLTAKKDPAGEPISIEQQLVQEGFSRSTIKDIADKMIEESVSLRTKNLTELMADDAKPEERSAANKLISLITSNFTPAEKKILLETTATAGVNKAWKDYSVSLAVQLSKGNVAKGVEILLKLWSVIPVSFALSGVKFNGDVTVAFEKLKSPRPTLSVVPA